MPDAICRPTVGLDIGREAHSHPRDAHGLDGPEGS